MHICFSMLLPNYMLFAVSILQLFDCKMKTLFCLCTQWPSHSKDTCLCVASTLLYSGFCSLCVAVFIFRYSEEMVHVEQWVCLLINLWIIRQSLVRYSFYNSRQFWVQSEILSAGGGRGIHSCDCIQMCLETWWLMYDSKHYWPFTLIFRNNTASKGYWLKQHR